MVQRTSFGRGSGVLLAVINYNGLKALGSKLFSMCLSSIRKTIYHSGSIRLVFVDNASNDESVQFVKKYFPEFEILSLAKNMGYGAACNYVIRQYPHYEYYAFLNNDVIVDGNWLTQIIKVLDSHKVIGAASPKIYNFNSKRWNFGGFFHILPFSIAMDLSRYSSKDFILCSGIHGAAFVVKKHVYLKCGGFDEDYFLYDEDADFSLRVWASGYAIVHVKNSIVYHLGGRATRLTIGTMKSESLAFRNSLYTSFKNLSLSVALLRTLITFAYAVLIKPYIIKELIEGLASLKKFLRKRNYNSVKSSKTLYKLFRGDKFLIKKIVYEKIYRNNPGY